MQVIDFDQNDNFKFCSDVSHFKLEIKGEYIGVLLENFMCIKFL